MVMVANIEEFRCTYSHIYGPMVRQSGLEMNEVMVADSSEASQNHLIFSGSAKNKKLFYQFFVVGIKCFAAMWKSLSFLKVFQQFSKPKPATSSDRVLEIAFLFWFQCLINLFAHIVRASKKRCKSELEQSRSSCYTVTQIHLHFSGARQLYVRSMLHQQ